MNYAVILAGGVGSRFWPFSRELEPKQFMHLFGEFSLLQATLSRLKNTVTPENTYIVTNQIYFYELKSQIEKFHIPQENIILEPVGKNTAPAIGLCAQLISQIDAQATLIVLPSDHYIKNIPAFRATLKKAIVCARRALLVTLGIKPRVATSGFGYIKVKKGIVKDDNTSYYRVEKFLEKPPLEKAKKYFKDKRFFWNGGIFVWKASVFMQELKAYLPQLYAQLVSIKSKEDIPRVWAKIRPISVDYGILEHSGKIALVPARFDWTDLGSWEALNEVLAKNSQGNIIRADSLDLGSEGICVLSRSGRLISTVGLRDLIIADTPDALLVCSKDNTQEVKKIVELLKSRKRKECFVHLNEKRPWGSFTVLQIGKGFKIKLIEIAPGKRLSLQRHKKRAEHWVVVEGTAKVTVNNEAKLVQNNQSVYISKGIKHRLENSTGRPLKIVEVQTGGYLEEDDIQRFSDDFQR